MLLPYHILFLSTLVLRTSIALSATHWLFLWVGLELNILSFIALIHSDQKTKTTEATVKYFIIQAAGSILFLTAGISSQSLTPPSTLTSTLILIRIFIKLGAAPFHFWFPPVASSLNWTSLLILTTWQKLAPLGVLSVAIKWSSSTIPLLIATIRTLIGGLGGIGQTQLRPIVAFSSIAHLGWIIALAYVNSLTMLLYFIIYVTLIYPLITIFKRTNTYSLLDDKIGIRNKVTIIVSGLLLSLGGVPPLSGFILKWMSVQILVKFISPILLIAIILGRLLSLYFYLNILLTITKFFPLRLKNPPTPRLFVTVSFSSLFLIDLLILLIYALALFHKP